MGPPKGTDLNIDSQEQPMQLPMKSTTDPEKDRAGTITAGGPPRTACEPPTARHSHSLKCRVLHFTFEFESALSLPPFAYWSLIMRQTELCLTEEGRSAIEEIRSKGLNHARQVNRARRLSCLDQGAPDTGVAAMKGSVSTPGIPMPTCWNSSCIRREVTKKAPDTRICARKHAEGSK